MITKIKAFFYLELVFFLTMLSVILIPFFLLKIYYPQVPHMHFYFIGVIALFKFSLPTNTDLLKNKIRLYLEKKNQFSNQKQVDLLGSLIFYKDLVYIIFAIILFLAGSN